MFEPKNQDIDCPKCDRREIYFDRGIGFYCMACGRKFSADEAEFLAEYERFQAKTEGRFRLA